jgi:hypothetical protein
MLLASGYVAAGEPLYPVKADRDFGATVTTLGLKPAVDMPVLEGDDTVQIRGWCGPRFHGGFYGGGFGCYRPFYGGYYGGFGCYRPFYGSYYGGFGCYRPYYSYYSYSYSPYCYGGFCGISGNSGNIAPAVRLGTPQMPTLTETTPAPMPAAKDPTFRYDGGPRAPAPADREATPEQPAPKPTVPAEGRVVSLPARKPAAPVEYPAFGEDLPRKKSSFAEDRTVRR